MKQVKVETKYICDVCGKEVPEKIYNSGVNEYCSTKISISYEVWYAGHYNLGICNECESKISNYIISLTPNKTFPTGEKSK